MDNYQPNSHKYKEEKKTTSVEQKPQKVVNGQVSIKKKNGIQKIANTFINEDMPKVKNYILADVLIPAIKKAISDIVRNGIDMVLYGEDARSRDSKRPGSKVSYNSIYSSSSRDRDRDRDIDHRGYNKTSIFDYDDIVISDRGEAELVLNQMDDLIEKYGFVKVADLYDLIGITTNNHCAHNYGWTDLHTARVVGVRDGYVLKLPKALPID